jgi:hypothetical protein
MNLSKFIPPAFLYIYRDCINTANARSQTNERDMSAPSSVLPTRDMEDRVKDEEPISDANTLAEKHDNETETETGHETAQEIEPEEELAPDEYPKGFQFFFILLSLILSIFMIALDLV